MIYEKYIRRCFQLARLGLGNAAPNPMVGSVIVHENKIIGEGFHKAYGGPHAEVNAVRSVLPEHLPLLAQSTVYVSLEPCFHYGKTPPCVDLLLKHQVKKVVISCIDPNPKVGGKSVEKLRANGIEVVTGVLEKEGKAIAKRFFTYHTKKRPYIILKYAQSSDGYIGKIDQQFWITNAASKQLVHKWRSEEGAILVGTNTAAIDNPKLTNRLWSGKSPLRVVLDKTGRLSNNLHLFDNQHQTIVFTEQSQFENQSNLTYTSTDFNGQLLNKILTHLHQQKINSLIVEGGAAILNSFIEQNLWDEARVFIGKKWIGNGIKAPQLPFDFEEEKEMMGDRLLYFYNK